MEFSKKLKRLRVEKKVTQEQLAAVLQIERSGIGKYETGKSMPSLEVMNRIAEYFEVSVDYLTGRTDSRDGQPGNIFPICKKKIPLLGEIACGKPVFCDEERESYVISGVEIEADFCLRAKGNSMTGARILDGDIVFIKSQPSVDNGQIAAVIINDEATLKRVYYYPERAKLVLQAENPAFEPLVYVGQELEEVHILGLAVAFQSDVR